MYLFFDNSYCVVLNIDRDCPQFFQVHRAQGPCRVIKPPSKDEFIRSFGATGWKRFQRLTALALKHNNCEIDEDYKVSQDAEELPPQVARIEAQKAVYDQQSKTDPTIWASRVVSFQKYFAACRQLPRLERCMGLARYAFLTPKLVNY